MRDTTKSIIFFLKSFGLIISVCVAYAIIRIFLKIFVDTSDLDRVFSLTSGLFLLGIFFSISLFFSVLILKPLYSKYPKTIFVIPFLAIILLSIITFLTRLLFFFGGTF